VTKSAMRLAMGVVFLSGSLFAQPKAPQVRILVDGTQAPRKIFHTKMEIPAAAGILTLYYPKWIPGEHGPTGPIQDLTGLKFSANGQTLSWRRDLLDGWTFHVQIPQGVTGIEAELDFIAPIPPEGGQYTGGASATDKMTVLNWNTLLLYPAGWTSDQLTYEAELRLPEGWKFATSLRAASQSGGDIKFQPVSLTTLMDSPIAAGEYQRVVSLAENPHQELDLTADSAIALEGPEDFLDRFKVVTEQAYKLFGARHFREYHFLYSLSDHIAHFGLEHHESDDSRVGERYLVDPELRLSSAGLLTHEYVHSWNGKYRRPADLSTPDYQQPMQDDLLWVYEGLTQYLGDLLAARAGVRTPQQYREEVARIAAVLDYRSGRTWRNLQDTADGVPTMQDAPHEWEDWRRPLDYYEEDELNWLWADTIIRRQTQGRKSLDDFCHLFHGGSSGAPELKTYTFEDVISALNQVAPYDWRGFWGDRLTNHGPGAPLGGIENSGWKLVYDGNPSDVLRAWERSHAQINVLFSIGIMLEESGRIVDTVESMPAAKAGIGPGMKIVAVNGRRFTLQVFFDALRATAKSQPMELLIENSDYFKSYRLDYSGGEKYPHLVRDESKPDMLSEIIRAR